MIKLLIFDLDGTLVDSAQDIVDTTNFVMSARGRQPLPRETVVAAIGEGLKKLVFDLFPETHSDPVKLDELEAEFFAAYEAHLLKHSVLYPGVTEFLDGWNGQIAIVTNKYEKLALRTVAGLGLDRFPWVKIFGAESLPERKPHPLPLQEVMRAAGRQPHEALMIGDGVPDMVSARRAGIHSIACEFGYCSKATLQAENPSLFVGSFAELPSVIAVASRLSPRTPSLN